MAAESRSPSLFLRLRQATARSLSAGNSELRFPSRPSQSLAPVFSVRATRRPRTRGSRVTALPRVAGLTSSTRSPAAFEGTEWDEPRGECILSSTCRGGSVAAAPRFWTPKRGFESRPRWRREVKAPVCRDFSARHQAPILVISICIAVRLDAISV